MWKIDFEIYFVVIRLAYMYECLTFVDILNRLMC